MSIGVKRSIKVITAFIELRIVYELEDEKLYVHIVSVFIKGEIVIFHVFRNKVNQSLSLISASYNVIIYHWNGNQITYVMSAVKGKFASLAKK